MDGFAGSEVEGEGGAGGVFGDVDPLGVEGFEVHLDAGFGGVPEGYVAEGRGLKSAPRSRLRRRGRCG